MESHIPTRPTSDLRRRLPGHKPPPSAIETQRQTGPGPFERRRTRSSSFSSFGRSLSRLLPSNRKERGGTVRFHGEPEAPMSGQLPQVSDVIGSIAKDGKTDDVEGDGGEVRMTRSWSPKKVVRVADEWGKAGTARSKTRKPGTLKRLWDLHIAANADDGTDDFSQHPDRLRTEKRELRRVDEKIKSARLAAEKDPTKIPVPIMVVQHQEAEVAIKRSQQLFEEKKFRREERRSIRDSDDYLGIQGVNPRTGYPDPNTATSSSAGDGTTESTKRRLEEDARRMESASREYRAALERRERETRRLEMERERRKVQKKEKAEKKRVELKARMRRDGRWRSQDNRWSMVVEPELSPIPQSVSGSLRQETLPADRLLPMPSAANSSPYPELVAQVGEDYFGPSVSPSKIPQRYQKPYELASNSSLPTNYQFPFVESAPNTPQPRKYKFPSVESAPNTPQPRKYQFPYVEPAPNTPQPKKYTFPYVESAPNIPRQSRLTVSPGRVSDDHQGSDAETARHGPPPIRQQSVGSPSPHSRASSTETVVHNASNVEHIPAELPNNPTSAPATTTPLMTPKLDVTTPGETMRTMSPMSLTRPEHRHFLDMYPDHSNLGGLPKSKAIATSFQSATMSQVLSRRSSLQSPRDTSLVKRITSLNELPPVILKDPITTRVPSSPKNPRIPILSQVINSTQGLPLERENEASTTITPITTTTGFAPLLRLPGKIDGANDINEVQASPQRLTPASSRIARTSFRMKDLSSGTQNTAFQTNPAGSGTLSAARPLVPWTHTEPPTPRLGRAGSLDPGKKVAKSTPTSTSASMQSQRLAQHQISKTAARKAFSHTIPQRLDSAVKARSVSLASPKARTTGTQEPRDRGCKINSGLGNADTGDLFRTRGELERDLELLKRRIEQARRCGGPTRNGGNDGLVVWCNPEQKRVAIDNKKPTLGNVKGVQSSLSRKLRGPGKAKSGTSLLQKTYRMMKEKAKIAWRYVAPVLNPRSGLRWRWVRNELTWRDTMLIAAAGLFGGAAFLLIVLCARIVEMGLQIIRGMVNICRLLIGF